MHQTNLVINTEVSEASKRIAEREYPDIDDLIVNLVLHSIGQRMLDYRARIESGESTVKLALLDHGTYAELLGTSAVDMIHRRLHPGAACRNDDASCEVIDQIGPLLESAGIAKDLQELGLGVVANAIGHSGKYNIVIRTVDT